MDATKLKVLQGLPYRIQPVCGNCVNAVFPRGLEWTTCDAVVYQHEKHVGEPRNLSIHKTGVCPKHAFDPQKTGELGAGWLEFVPGRSK